MPYQVRFTDYTNPFKAPKTVDDYSLNTETSVTFVGKSYAGYAPYIAENFLHLLENFAKSSPPSNPVEGQIWYDNSPESTQLKVFNGSQWIPATAVKKSSLMPDTASSTVGDLWVNTQTQQLFLYTGSTWILVGPQYSTGAQTGPVSETIQDILDVAHTVISMFSNGRRIAIISSDSFTPKSLLAGFPSVKPGITLTNLNYGTTQAEKVWGTATQAESLLVNGTQVPASNFFRLDQPSTTNYQVSIRSSNGVSIGSDLSLSIATDVTTSSPIFTSKANGSSFYFKTNNAGSIATSLYLSANSMLGVGANNTSPQATLDVNGSVIARGTISVTDSTDASSSAASISTAGGIKVDKKSYLKGEVNCYGTLKVNNLNDSNIPQYGVVISPGTTDASGIYDIGSASNKFKGVYASNFYGTLTGNVTGDVTGNVSGSASKLASATRFSIGDNGPLLSDIASNVINFDGQGDDPAIFTAQVVPGFIANKPEATDTLDSDTILIYRNSAGLKKQTKKNFLANIATMPIGVLLPFSGTTAPAGYLLCDGSEVAIADYPDLYNVIGYTYRSPSLLNGFQTFALPDLRGRFPLGRDNMDNGLTVKDKNDPMTLIDAGGGSANRVTDISGDTVGQSAGSESTTLTVENIPDHAHNLNSSTAQYWAGGSPAGLPDSEAVYGNGLPSTSTGYGINKTGGVIAASHGDAFKTMNPYLTVNYIIFTGVL